MWGSILALIIVGMIGGDFIYATVIKHRLNKWEKNIPRDVDGVRQGCQEFTKGDGDIALLMIHGFGDSPAVYTNLAPALASMGFTCKTMRLHGFAEPMSKYSKTNLNLWIEALDNQIHQLHQSHSKIWIIAHSLGGAITIRYLLDHPQSVDGVILLAPLLEVSNDNSPLLPARTWHKFGTHCLFITTILENYLPVDIHDPKVREKHQVFCDRFIPRVVYNELFKLLDSINGKANEFNLPLLMMLSSDDKVINPKTAERFYEEAASTSKHIIFLKNSGHVIPLDYQWKDAVSDISEFIERNVTTHRKEHRER